MKELKFKKCEVVIIITDSIGVNNIFKFADAHELSANLKDLLKLCDDKISGNKFIVYQCRESDSGLYLAERIIIDFKMIYGNSFKYLFDEIMIWID